MKTGHRPFILEDNGGHELAVCALTQLRCILYNVFRIFWMCFLYPVLVSASVLYLTFGSACHNRTTCVRQRNVWVAMYQITAACILRICFRNTNEAFYTARSKRGVSRACDHEAQMRDGRGVESSEHTQPCDINAIPCRSHRHSPKDIFSRASLHVCSPHVFESPQLRL